ncbi:MAG TPA: GGDEF domain-containing protein, partial [Gemmatimonadales bacterium]|nr:GGDEF domain-containing protein [Gemmatimonadales bacterium]
GRAPILRPVPLRRGAVLGLGAGVTLAIYFANAFTPAVVKLGLFYLVPVLFVTWYDGIAWGTAFAIVAMALRLRTEMVEVIPPSPIGILIFNQASFAVVAGVTMFAFRYMHRTQVLLQVLAEHDQLTQVLNARSFTDRLAAELRRNRRYGRPLSLLYLDLDDFKRVNDTQGHQTGDAVLRLAADAIRRAVRQADMVGRMGGDEFAVLLPETDGELAYAAADRLATELRSLLDGSPTVTASIGVVSSIGREADTDAVLRRADLAMYDAKRSGKNRIVRVAM